MLFWPLLSAHIHLLSAFGDFLILCLCVHVKTFSSNLNFNFWLLFLNFILSSLQKRKLLDKWLQEIKTHPGVPLVEGLDINEGNLSIGTGHHSIVLTANNQINVISKLPVAIPKTKRPSAWLIIQETVLLFWSMFLGSRNSEHCFTLFHYSAD